MSSDAQAVGSQPGAGRRRGLRPADSWKWRTACLVGVHLLILAHVTHWLVNGTTVAGIGPSEAMELAKHSVVNVGLLCFAAAILTTAVFGRFFCGWGCHLIALQDLSRWLLGRLGIRPRPLRSRLQRLVPIGAFAYMFLWPVAYRLWIGDDLGTVETAFTTTDLWADLPGLTIGALTLAVCGFLIVYVLGSRGFCTYACPYGAVIGAADRFAPVRVRVTDACQQCARCTAGCSSNVRVHEEVRDYGMVVDRGCMRCLDCVGTCPSSALYLGAGRPPLLKRAREGAVGYRRRWNAGWGEELLLAAVWVAAFFTFRGLYGAVPFLVSLGISGTVAFLCLSLVRLARKPEMRFGGFRLRRGGSLTRAGWVFISVMVLILAVSGHSAAIRVQEYLGNRLYRQTAGLRAAALDLGAPLGRVQGAELGLVQGTITHLEAAQRWGLFVNPRYHLQLAWMHLLSGQHEAYLTRMAAAARAQPFSAELHLLRARALVEQGQYSDAVMACAVAVELAPQAVDGFLALGILLARLGDVDRSIQVFDRGIAAVPGAASLYHNCGVAHALRGDTEQAIRRFEQALEADPGHLEARENLAGALLSVGRHAEGAEHLERAAERVPGDARTR